ncbi:hypothetical protein DFR30_2164 [Thiogranum longum]|uniref:Uncharacterized protein n=1 Tax=Thiogranum longum TaxID=1537524 RepID=A0A4R1HHJ8_9GAMM|nr:hypothetical protein DFR30_2164 [Thiogranum longum]
MKDDIKFDVDTAIKALRESKDLSLVEIRRIGRV